MAALSPLPEVSGGLFASLPPTEKFTLTNGRNFTVEIEPIRDCDRMACSEYTTLLLTLPSLEKLKYMAIAPDRAIVKISPLNTASYICSVRVEKLSGTVSPDQDNKADPITKLLETVYKIHKWSVDGNDVLNASFSNDLNQLGEEFSQNVVAALKVLRPKV